MIYPQVVLLAHDDWAGKQLQPLLKEQKWLLHEFRQLRAWLEQACEVRPTVACLQVNWHQETSATWPALVELAQRHPDASVLVFQDTKLHDDDRPRLVASALDLGARLVLVPPLTKQVLEDAVCGLMRERIRVATKRATARPIDLAEVSQTGSL